MPLLNLVIVVVLIGFVAATGLSGRRNSRPASPSPEVASATIQVDQSPEPAPSAAATPTLDEAAKTTSNSKSDITIKVDSQTGNTTPAAEKLVYPGATAVSNNQYTVNVSGSTVYEWYKTEMNRRNYQIRNNVKTQANEKFKAVLQGVSVSRALKVTIDQENYSAATVITVE